MRKSTKEVWDRIPPKSVGVELGKDEINIWFGDINYQTYSMSTCTFFDTINQTVDWVYVSAHQDFVKCLLDLRKVEIIMNSGSIFGNNYGIEEEVTKAVDRYVEESGYPFDNFHKDFYEIKI